MSSSGKPEKRSYESLYREFDSPLMSRLRREAYGEDIGQHSWVTADDLRCDVPRLKLFDGARLLDLGCGPCGPLSFIVKSLACSAIGLDLSAAAVAAGRRRAAAFGLENRLTIQEADLDAALPMADSSIDAAISLDVILHLRDRLRAFGGIARVLVPGGRFLFTDGGIVTGSISSEEVALRSMHGFVQFCAPGYNEKLLQAAGFALIETEDRTRGMRATAEGRLRARVENQADVERLEGVEEFARYQAYLHSVVATAERYALSRVMYLAEKRMAGRSTEKRAS
jgi:SAM-dependent methyltransferase